MKVNQVKCWFLRRGETGVPGENLSVQSREPTNSTHIWRRVRESTPGHIGGRRVLSPLRHPCTPQETMKLTTIQRLTLIKHAFKNKFQYKFYWAKTKWPPCHKDKLGNFRQHLKKPQNTKTLRKLKKDIVHYRWLPHENNKLHTQSAVAKLTASAKFRPWLNPAW